MPEGIEGDPNRMQGRGHPPRVLWDSDVAPLEWGERQTQSHGDRVGLRVREPHEDASLAADPFLATGASIPSAEPGEGCNAYTKVPRSLPSALCGTVDTSVTTAVVWCSAARRYGWPLGVNSLLLRH